MQDEVVIVTPIEELDGGGTYQSYMTIVHSFYDMTVRRQTERTDRVRASVIQMTSPDFLRLVEWQRERKEDDSAVYVKSIDEMVKRATEEMTIFDQKYNDEYIERFGEMPKCTELLRYDSDWNPTLIVNHRVVLE